jgi:hypothetical protein
MPSVDPEKLKRFKKAAQLVAAGELDDQDIAIKVGIGRTTLYRWRKLDKFNAKIEAYRQAIHESLMHRAISSVEQRINRNNRDWLKLQEVIRQRADDPEVRKAAGGSTGLLVRIEKSIGSGDSTKIVEEFAVDTATLKALLDLEKQAAIEIGQWNEKTTTDIKGGPLLITYVNDWRSQRADDPTPLPPSGTDDGSEASEAV